MGFSAEQRQALGQDGDHPPDRRKSCRCISAAVKVCSAKAAAALSNCSTEKLLVVPVRLALRGRKRRRVPWHWLRNRTKLRRRGVPVEWKRKRDDAACQQTPIIRILHLKNYSRPLHGPALVPPLKIDPFAHSRFTFTNSQKEVAVRERRDPDDIDLEISEPVPIDITRSSPIDEPQFTGCLRESRCSNVVEGLVS